MRLVAQLVTMTANRYRDRKAYPAPFKAEDVLTSVALDSRSMLLPPRTEGPTFDEALAQMRSAWFARTNGRVH